LNIYQKLTLSMGIKYGFNLEEKTFH